VVGDVDPLEVERIALEMLGSQKREAGQKLRPWQESMTCARQEVTAEMEVAMPMFQLGFKCEAPGKGEAAVREEIIGDLAAEALFGESSALYLQLYEQGLIDSSFGGGYETVDGMAILTCSGDSDDPQGVREAILAGLETLLAEGIADGDFLRMKRSALGRRIRDLDSFDSTCFRLCAYHFTGFAYPEFPALYQSIQKEEVQAFLRRVVTRARSCLSVIYPLKEA
jgi:predicted Zn-dependent peptidase